MDGTNDWDAVVRLLIAAGMALPIGLDRELNGKPAGLRTHLLLAITTAALAWLSIEMAQGRSNADPTRIASYTVAGIGFLGAGLIVGVRGRVYGLTTAVGAFAVMGIGLLNGAGYPLVAGAATLLSVLTLWPMEWVKARALAPRAKVEVTLHVTVTDATALADVMAVPAAQGLEVRAVDVVPVGDVATVQMTLRGTRGGIDAATAAVEAHPHSAGRPTESGVSGSDRD